ncbi:hypothetical protein SAMN05216328_1412 [Ensifer sp. YR511]|nr:hypothetical protein SAMN05216328_1412 [Ensifer sp. YR511]
MSDGALSGPLVIAIVQAVAGSLCTVRLADSTVRVVEIERAGGKGTQAYLTAPSSPFQVRRGAMRACALVRRGPWYP